MQLDEIHGELTRIFRGVFDDDGLEITDTTSAKDIDDWDSLNHINLIVVIEKQFRIKLSTPDVNKLRNIGDMKQMIQQKIGNR
jgi:acyl carrier protein